MSNNKQSSIEWLYNNLKSHFEHDGDLLEVIQMSFEQAKEMYKEERILDYYQGACDESDNHGAQYIIKKDAEQYYKETYETNNKN